MGTPIPEPYPVIQPTLWYCCNIDVYQSFVPGSGCVVFGSNRNHCILGQTIIDWVAADNQCSGIGLIGFPFFNNQRLNTVGIGYPTQAECVTAGCP